MPHLDLDDTEADALATLLTRTIVEDCYPLSQRTQVSKGILNKLRPPPARQPLPPLKTYEPPSAR